jgi:hypothetical protein
MRFSAAKDIWVDPGTAAVERHRYTYRLYPGFPALETFVVGYEKDEKSGPAEGERRELCLRLKVLFVASVRPHHFVLTRRFSRHPQQCSRHAKAIQGKRGELYIMEMFNLYK